MMTLSVLSYATSFVVHSPSLFLEVEVLIDLGHSCDAASFVACPRHGQCLHKMKDCN